MISIKRPDYFLTIGLGIVIGVIATLVVGHITEIVLKKELSMGELGNIVITILLALIIPLSLNKWLDDNKSVKGLFSFEVDSCLSALENIKNIIDINYEAKAVISDDDKKKINFLFSILDNKIAFLKERLNGHYENESLQIIKDITDNNLAYWKVVTNGDLMTNGYIISSEFMRRHTNSYLVIENVLKKTKYDINAL